MNSHEPNLEELFDTAFDNSVAGSRSRPSSTPPLVDELLRTATRLREMQFPDHQLNAARSRVARRVFSEIEQPSINQETYKVLQTAAPYPLPVRRVPMVFRAGALFAALLLVSFVLGWSVSEAAASSRPGSALYFLKRTQESVALNLAPSDQAKSTVLLTIAENRLEEAQSEAEAGHANEAKSLVTQFDDTMQQAIALAADMQARHEQTSQLLSRIDETLAEESALISSTGSLGMAEFAQSLSLAQLHEAAALKQQNLPFSSASTHQQNQQVNSGTPVPDPASQSGGMPTKTAVPGQHKPTGTPVPPTR